MLNAYTHASLERDSIFKRWKKCLTNLKIISATTKVISATQKVITATLKVISATT